MKIQLELSTKLAFQPRSVRLVSFNLLQSKKLGYLIAHPNPFGAGFTVSHLSSGKRIRKFNLRRNAIRFLYAFAHDHRFSKPPSLLSNDLSFSYQLSTWRP
jgi:hypothetical protein